LEVLTEREKVSPRSIYKYFSR